MGGVGYAEEVVDEAAAGELLAGVAGAFGGLQEDLLGVGVAGVGCGSCCDQALE